MGTTIGDAGFVGDGATVVRVAIGKGVGKGKRVELGRTEGDASTLGELVGGAVGVTIR